MNDYWLKVIKILILFYFYCRWEMMKDETLEEKGKMMLEHLKQIYSIQDSSLLDSTDKP